MAGIIPPAARRVVHAPPWLASLFLGRTEEVMLWYALRVVFNSWNHEQYFVGLRDSCLRVWILYIHIYIYLESIYLSIYLSIFRMACISTIVEVNVVTQCKEPIDTFFKVTSHIQRTSPTLLLPWLRSGLCFLVVHLFLVSRCTPCFVRQKVLGWFGVKSWSCIESIAIGHS